MLVLSFSFLCCLSTFGFTEGPDKPVFGTLPENPKTASKEKVKRDILKWSKLKDPLGNDINPVGYGKHVVPAALEILKKPGKYKSAVAYTIALLNRVGAKGKKIVKITERYILSEDQDLAMEAVKLLASAGGGSEYATILIPFLFEEKSYVRETTLKTLKKIGDRSTKLALQIWYRKIEKQDQKREHKWLDEETEKLYRKALKAINRRTNKKNNDKVQETEKNNKTSKDK